VIEIESLTKVFRRNVGKASIFRTLISRPKTESLVAIDHLDLRIAEGEFFSLLGPNGAGKTSTIKILCTLLLPDGGACRVAGFDVLKQPVDVRRSIGVSIRGERSVYWKLTGRQNLEYFASLYGIRGKTARARIEEVVEIVGLTDRIDDYVERYSMGMKQRLALGVSLVHRPPVLLLDEPTIGLDPNGARGLRTLLKDDLCRKHGVTVLYTTHYMQEADDLSDRLAIIHKGKKVADGTPTEVRGALGDSRVVEMTTSGDASKVIASLKDHPLVSKVSLHNERPGFTLLRIQARQSLTSVSQLAAVLPPEVDVRSVQLVQPSLEDVFVSLTGTTITERGDVETVG
jgi:ABC-2 type transport system ATP-binding protein